MRKFALLILFLIFIHSVTASILFEGEVNDRETFKAGSHYFYVQYIESTQGAIFKMDDIGGVMLIGECETRENIKYCYNGANYPKLDVKIESLEPDISIERTFSTKSPTLNEEVTVTVTLKNEGSKRATSIQYQDTYPSTVKVSSGGNAKKWEGSLDVNEEEQFTYTIKLTEIISFDSTATISYKFDGNEKTKKSSTETIEVQKPFSIDQTISTEAADKNELVTYNLTIANNDNSNTLTIQNLEITLPSKIDLVSASSELKKGDNKLTFKGSIEKEKTKNFEIKVKTSQVGKFTIDTQADLKIFNKDFKEKLEKTFNVGLSYISPIINVTDSIKSSSSYPIYIAIKNYGKDEIKNVSIKVKSDLFNDIEEKKNIAAGTALKLLDKTLTAPYTEKDEKHNIKVYGSYLSSSGRTYQFEKSAQLTITATPKIIQIIRELNKKEFHPGDEIKITVKLKNLKNQIINDIDVSDIFPKEIRSSLMGDVTKTLEELKPNEEKKLYSYSVVVPENYKEDEIEFKTILNAKIDGELIILKEIDKIKILKGEKSEDIEEEQKEESEEIEVQEEEINKTAESKEEIKESKENFFKRIINWIKGLFKKEITHSQPLEPI